MSAYTAYLADSFCAGAASPVIGAGAEMVTVISNALADRLFPNADAAEALGKRLTFGDEEKTRQTLTTVGVPPAV